MSFVPPAARCAPLIVFLGLAHAAETKLGPHSFTLPEGFEIELVAAPPLVQQPMMADFDELGRLYVADSSGSNAKVEKQLEEKPHRIVRLEDSDGDGRFDRSEVFADRLMFPEGVLHLDGSVYTGAPPTIWRLEDSDRDGRADRRTAWHEGKTLTGCANDLHGPYLGPDGWIYWCKGAFARQTYERPGRRTIDDHAAHVFRARPDHGELEAVMGGGMDNPVEVAWSPEGELFFSTTFFHHPEAGRRDALVHCIYGGAYPKVHSAIDGLQRTGELLPSLVELGPAAACSLMRYDAAALGPEYAGNLFSTLFNLRRVMRHVLAPAAGTFTATSVEFLISDNPDFHPTDVLEDADGSLLVVDTGGWYKLCCPTSQLAKPDVLGAIYRIRRRGMPHPDDPRGLKLAWASFAPTRLTPLLGDPRPAVRERAIRQLAGNGAAAVPALAQTLARDPSVAARRNAVWALTRIDGPEARAAVREALNDASASVQLTALHAVALHRDAAALPRLLELVQSAPAFQQRRAAEALGRIGDPRAVPALLAAAGSFRAALPPGLASAERIQEHALIYALIEIADRAATARGLEAPNPHVRRAAMIALDQMDGGGLAVRAIAPLLASPDPTLRSTASWVAVRHPEWGPDLADSFRARLSNALLSPPDQADLGRQLAQCARTPAIQALMAHTLADATAPVPTRTLVLSAMAEAGLTELPAAWVPALTACLGDSNHALTEPTLTCLRALPLAKANPASLSEALLALARDGTRADPVRLSALGVLPKGLTNVEPALFDLLLRGLDPAMTPAARSAACSVLTKARLHETQWIRLAETLQTVGPMELNRLLDAFEGASSDAVGRRFVQSLKASKALAGVRVDLLRQRLSQFPAPVQQDGRELLAMLDVDPAAQTARLDQLLDQTRDGDVRRGQAVFNSTKTACVTCHAMGYVGGRIGPDLTSVGQIRTERDLLEAIVFPSASFVRSFEPVIITTTDGDELSGVVLKDTDRDLLLATGAETTARIARSEIVDTRPGTVSVMPSGLDSQLSRQELADLLAFLKNTKWGAQ